MLYPRYIKPAIKEALSDTPVVLINGARQTGKTTLAKDIGGKKYQYHTFDNEGERQAAKLDPQAYVANLSKYSILDEVQRVPEIFSSIKLSVDENREPGRFLLTGSANILALPKLSDSLAGRMEVINLDSLAQVELEGKKSQFLEKAFNKQFRANFDSPLEANLIERIIAGGYPEPLQRSTPRRRKTWYTNYLDLIIQRDIASFSNIQHAEEIPQLLKKVSNQSGSLINVAELNEGFNFEVKTTKKYINILNQLFLLKTLPPWSSNRNKRLIKKPKLHLLDTGLQCALMGVTEKQLIDNRKLAGQLLETFVFNELRKQAAWHEEDVEFFHFRDKDKVEVDIIMQNSQGDLVGIEVKLASSVNERDFKGLQRFSELNERTFVKGILLYDGVRTLSFGNKLVAVPLQALWL